jgi:diadenosine tetraphosphate (Ap4A) HIT family hydrolase
MNLDHWKKFRPTELIVQDFEYWLVVVREKQITLGACVFLLKRPVASLGELDAAELAELSSVAAWFEHASRVTYGADKFNYLAAMMKDPYVHFHAFPRYGSEVSRYGVEWVDAAWPRAIELKDVSTSEEVLRSVQSELRSVEK